MVRSGPSPAALSVTSAKDAVEAGLQRFSDGDPATALQLFRAGLSMRPSPDEARAATYNSACALTALGRYQEALAQLESAVTVHDLALRVAERDPDLAALRLAPGWPALRSRLEAARGAQSSTALRAEARSPFRTLRLLGLGGVTLGAGLGAAVLAARLAGFLGRGEEASLPDALQNLAINLAVTGVAGFLLARDWAAGRRGVAQAAREEALGELRFLPPARGEAGVPRALRTLRGSRRPLVLAGRRSFTAAALASARPHAAALAQRGICVLPVVLQEDSETAEWLEGLRREFAAGKGAAGGEGFAAGPSPRAPAQSAPRWQLEPADPDQWKAWATESGLLGSPSAPSTAPETGYIVLDLDGCISGSGPGLPDWPALLAATPTLKLKESAAKKRGA
ncbi:LPA1 [Auxenochlorella protothecoides x Auxenochlorella symbiontica]